MYEKLKKKIEKIVESQKEALHKFVTSRKKNVNLNKNLVTEELISNTNEDYEKIIEEN